ncbi:hypothetical protein HFD88_007619 [Aspergillus terreus]|nr:hypothetical protein HFD88_007619 [Aspergillus terreus]
MIFNRAFANTLLLAPSLAAAAVNLHYEVGGHKKESSVGVDECTNLNGLLGVSNLQTTGKCHLYTFVDCIGAAVEAHRGPHVFSPPLIVGSIRCLEEDENADDTEEGAEELDE